MHIAPGDRVRRPGYIWSMVNHVGKYIRSSNGCLGDQFGSFCPLSTSSSYLDVPGWKLGWKGDSDQLGYFTPIYLPR